MSLSETQRTTLAAHIRANTDQDVIDALAVRNDSELTRLYNLASTFYVWRTSITPAEYRDAIVWTEVDGLTTGKARIWEWITQNMTMAINTSSANVRQGLADAFAQNTTTRPNLLAIAKRFATVAESIFSTGTGTSGNPGTLGFEGTITTEDVGRALNDNP